MVTIGLVNSRNSDNGVHFLIEKTIAKIKNFY